jgi:hypothetical protein
MRFARAIPTAARWEIFFWIISKIDGFKAEDARSFFTD